MPTTILDQLASTGIVGILGALGFWAAWSGYKREVARNDRLEAELRSVRKRVEDRLLPALLESTRLNNETAELLRGFTPDRPRNLNGGYRVRGDAADLDPTR